MLRAGGQVATHTVAPAAARALAMAKPKPPSSATPATRARRPERSMLSITVLCVGARCGQVCIACVDAIAGGRTNAYHRPAPTPGARAPSRNVHGDAAV